MRSLLTCFLSLTVLILAGCEGGSNEVNADPLVFSALNECKQCCQDEDRKQCEAQECEFKESPKGPIIIIKSCDSLEYKSLESEDPRVE